MEKRTCASYVSVFKEAKKAFEEHFIKVDRFLSDYEVPLRTAAKEIFPNARLVGCYFHFARAVFKKFKHMGLCKAEDQKIRMAIKMAMNIPLLPQKYISTGFDIVRGKLIIYTSFQIFFPCTLDESYLFYVFFNVYIEKKKINFRADFEIMYKK